ncbi:MAG TPA: DEAD/DEAH box helicase [Longimicrobium sp.]|nr:DEAD/DEAH box helicase [Longimicrobium sp.]
MSTTPLVEAQAIPARAEIAASMDAVVISPREAAMATAIRRTLTAAGAAPRGSAGGFRILPDRFAQLLEASDAIDIAWAVGSERFVRNRLELSRRHATALSALRALVAGGRQAATATLCDIQGLEQLDDHQVVNVAAMTIPEAPGLCILDEQGTGKTVVTIYGFDALVARKEVDFLLILAPKSMVPEWICDFERFKGDLYDLGAMVGDRREKRAALAARKDVLVTNYETAVSMEAELSAHLRQHRGRAMLVVDESFFAKNFDAARTRAIRRLREECDRAYVLCGTPAPNRPHDVVEQFNIVDFGATFGGVKIPEDRAAALPVIRQAMEARGLYVRHRKQDVLPDLPQRRYTRVPLALRPEQRRAYEAALQNLILDLRSTDDREFARRIPSILARHSALLQICASPASVIPGYSEIPAKLLALDEILEDAIVRGGEKVVVWSFFTDSIDAIVQRYERFFPARYDGQVTDVRARREAVRRFQEDDSTMLFVANPAAAGAGLTLHRARIAVYESLSINTAHFLQSLDRIHRRGQRRDVDYIFLVCEGSIEIQEYERIATKEAAARDLLSDGGATPPTREVLLREALDLHRLINEVPLP